MTVYLLGLLPLWLAYRLLGPSARVVWSERRMLVRAAAFRLRHPRRWAAAAREVHAAG